MEKIGAYIYLLPLLLLVFLWLLRYPSKATYLLAFTIPLSPYIPISESAYAARSALLLNLSDLIVASLLVSSFFGFCLENKSGPRYPLHKINISILLFYAILLVLSSIIRPAHQSLFQMVYLIRYSLYILIGFYVWKYLPVKNVERYIIILLIALLANSVYGIYSFFDLLMGGAAYTGVRGNGFWSLIIGLNLEPGIADPANFAMYLAMTLIMNLFYISYMKPVGLKRTLALVSLFLGYIALHMTLSRSEIVAFWCILLYLLFFMRRNNLRLIIIAFFALTVISGTALIMYIGIDLFSGVASRLYGTFGELTVKEGRFNQVYELFIYLQDRIVHWWGHGISSWRLYKDEFFRIGVIDYASGSLYNGYATVFWDAGIIGVIVWLIWLKGHFIVLQNIKNKKREVYWMAMGLKAIIICFLISMIATSIPLHNFRLMGYLSFLLGVLLKYVYQSRIESDELREAV